jgi:hypothetical protein
VSAAAAGPPAQAAGGCPRSPAACSSEHVAPRSASGRGGLGALGLPGLLRGPRPTAAGAARPNPRTRHSPDAHARPTHRAHRHTQRTGTTDHHITRTAQRNVRCQKGSARAGAGGFTPRPPRESASEGGAKPKGGVQQLKPVSLVGPVRRDHDLVCEERMQVVVVRVPVGSHRSHPAAHRSRDARRLGPVGGVRVRETDRTHVNTMPMPLQRQLSPR